MLSRLNAVVVFILLGLVCQARVAYAQDCSQAFDYRQFSLRLPASYRPLPPSRLQNGLSYAFRDDKPDDQIAAVLQVVFYDFADELEEAQPAAVEAAKTAYLNRFLGGIEKRRGEFKKSEVIDRALNQVGYKKIDWSGKAYGADMAGALYSTVFRGTVVSISIQDSAARRESSLRELEACLATLTLTGEW